MIETAPTTVEMFFTDGTSAVFTEVGLWSENAWTISFKGKKAGDPEAKVWAWERHAVRGYSTTTTL